MSSLDTPKRGPYARTLRRRQDIAEVVRRLVLEHGHEAVTVAMIAEEAATPEATLLYHFPTRDHMLISALELADRDVATGAGADDPSVVMSLEALRATANAISQHDRMFQLLQAMKGNASSTDHPAGPFFTERQQRQIDIFSRLVEGRQRSGMAHPGLDVRQVAIQILALWDGLTSIWLTTPMFDLGEMLVSAYRRLAGENVIAARAFLEDPGTGL